MEYYLILGIVVACLIALYTFMSAFRKSVQEEMKPMHDLNTSVVKLNATIDTKIEYMIENDKVRDNRLNKHSERMDDIEDSIHENEKVLANHETRIKSLEKKV